MFIVLIVPGSGGDSQLGSFEVLPESIKVKSPSSADDGSLEEIEDTGDDQILGNELTVDQEEPGVYHCIRYLTLQWLLNMTIVICDQDTHGFNGLLISLTPHPCHMCVTYFTEV